MVVLSCVMDGICAVPDTPKILFPEMMFPPTRLASPEMVCVPVRYVPEAIVWFEVDGVIVAAALVVTEAVKDTEEFPAVPEETYPAVTCGVLDTVLDRVKVFVPVETVALVPEMVAAGVALPEDTDLLAAVE